MVRVCARFFDYSVGGGIAEGGEVLAVVVGEVGGGEEVGAVGEGLGERGLAAPAADGEVVAVAEDVGDGEAEEVGGAGVVGVVEDAVGGVGGAGDLLVGWDVFGVQVGSVAFAEAFVAAGVGVAERAGEEADGGVEEDGGG